MPLISNFCNLIFPAVQGHRFTEAAASNKWLWAATVSMVPAEIGGDTVGRKWREIGVIYFRCQGEAPIAVGKNVDK